MIWFCFQLASLLITLATPHHRTFEVEVAYLTSLLAFELLWLAQRRLPALNLLATLTFSALLGCTTMIFLMGGGAVSLGLCWPALALRWEDSSLIRSRGALIGSFAVLAWSSLQGHSAWYFFLPVLLTLWQFQPNRIARFCNTAALAWTVGALAEALCVNGPEQEAMLRTGVLLVLPQIGLRVLNGRSAKGDGCSCSSITPACSTEPFIPHRPPSP